MQRSPYEDPDESPIYVKDFNRFIDLFARPPEQESVELDTRMIYNPSGPTQEDSEFVHSVIIPIGSEHQVSICQITTTGSKWAVFIEISKRNDDESLECVMAVHQGPLCDVRGAWEFYPCEFPRLHELVGDLLPEPLRRIHLEDCLTHLLPEEIEPSDQQIDSDHLYRILSRLLDVLS